MRGNRKLILANEKLKYFLDAPVLRRAGPEEVGRGGRPGGEGKIKFAGNCTSHQFFERFGN